MRQAQARRGPARDAGEQLEQLLQRQVAVGEDVALADASAFGGQQVPRGDVADVDQVEAGVDVRRESARQEVDDNLSGRRRLDVPVADRAWTG